MTSTITQFGLQPFTEEQRARLSFLSPHEQSLLQYHRGFEAETTMPLYVYTGRGPSHASFHIGHLPALKLCLTLQNYFGQLIEFMIADDEKMFRDHIDPDTMGRNVSNTLAQLEAIGFNSSNTRFRINSHGINTEEYSLLIRMLGTVSIGTLNSIFGEKSSVGEYFYPLLQILPCFSVGRQCVVVAGVDQDPFFRLARELARRFGYPPPIVFYTASVPGLDGSEKMSTSAPETIPIFLDDSPAVITEKVRRIRKVGAGSLEELFTRGADLSQDVPFQLLKLFDRNTIAVELIARAYTTGITDAADIEALCALIPTEKAIQSRNGRTMLTTLGIRSYLTTILISVLFSI